MKTWCAEAAVRKWRWAGHIARRDGGRWSKKLLMLTSPDVMRGRGRPRARWSDSVQKEVEEAGHDWPWWLVAQDRPEWRHIGEEAAQRREAASRRQAAEEEEEEEQSHDEEEEQSQQKAEDRDDAEV